MAPAYFLYLVPYYRVASLAMVVGSLVFAGLLDLSAITDLGTYIIGTFEHLSKYEYYLKHDQFLTARTESGTYLGFVAQKYVLGVDRMAGRRNRQATRRVRHLFKSIHDLCRP